MCVSMDIIDLYISSWVYIYINGNTSNLGSWDGQWIHSYLVGGFKHFLFSIIYGKILPIDFHIFQDGWNHQPVIYVYIYIWICTVLLSHTNVQRILPYMHITCHGMNQLIHSYRSIHTYLSFTEYIYIYLSGLCMDS